MATKSKQLNDWLVALSPLGNTVFLSYIICVHSKHCVQSYHFNFSSTTTTTFISLLQKNIRRMGTSSRSNDFWDGLGEQVLLMVG